MDSVKELAVVLVEDSEERIRKFEEDIRSRWSRCGDNDDVPLVLSELSLTPLRKLLRDDQPGRRELLLFLDLRLEDTLYNEDPNDSRKKPNHEHIREGFELLSQSPLLEDKRERIDEYRNNGLHGLSVLPWILDSPWARRVVINLSSSGGSLLDRQTLASLEKYLESNGKRIEFIREEGGGPFFEYARSQDRKKYWRESLHAVDKLRSGFPESLARMIEAPSGLHSSPWSHDSINENPEHYVDAVAKWLRWDEAPRNPSSRLLNDFKVLFMLPEDPSLKESLFSEKDSEARVSARRCWKVPARYTIQEETLKQVLMRLSQEEIVLSGELDRLRLPIVPALPFLTGLARMLNAVTQDKQVAPESVNWTVTQAGTLGYVSRIKVALSALPDSEITLAGRLYQRILTKKSTALRGTSRAVFAGAFCRSIKESEVESGRGWQHLFTGATIRRPPVAIRFCATGFSFIWFHR